MKTLLKLLRLEFLPVSTDFALLVLRLWFGGSMLVLHGWGKFLQLTKAPGDGFPDPLGIGAVPSHALAVFGEVVCPVLLILGLFTRFAALSCAITMGVAFFIMHKGALSGSDSGELAFIYLAGYVALLLAGGGHYGMDAAKAAKAPVKKKD
jgi:putative oxidoreductase